MPAHTPRVHTCLLTHTHMLTWEDTRPYTCSHAGRFILTRPLHVLTCRNSHPHSHVCCTSSSAFSHAHFPTRAHSHAHMCTPTCIVTHMLTGTHAFTHVFAHACSGPIAAAMTSGAKDLSCFFFPNTCSHNKENRKGLGASTGRGSGLRTGSRLQRGGPWAAGWVGLGGRQTDGRLPSGAVDRPSTASWLLVLTAAPHRRHPFCFQGRNRARGWRVPVTEEGWWSWHSTGRIRPRSHGPASCSPLGSGHSEGLCLSQLVARWGSSAAPLFVQHWAHPWHPGLDSGSLGAALR